MAGLASTLGPWPREHGAWAMLIVPWAVGGVLGGGLTPPRVLVLIGALALFLAQHRLADWHRHRSSTAWPDRRATLGSLTLLTAVGLAALAAALAAVRTPVVTVLAGAGVLATAASLILVGARRDHALPGQALAAVALALTAPAAYLAGGSGHPRTALALWAVNAAFFLWGVLYVNLQILARTRQRVLRGARDRLRCAAPTLAADLVLALVVVMTVRVADLSALALAAFLPAALQSITAAARLGRLAPLKRVGLAMLAHSVAFAVLFTLLA